MARFGVHPGAGTTLTPFAFDASATADVEDAIGALSFAWDFNSDGVTDATGVTTANTFSTNANHVVTLTVTDSHGLRDTYSLTVPVVASGSLFVVTTANDTVDSGDGLISLREAIASAAGAPGGEVITFTGPMTINTASVLSIPTGASDTVISGEPGVIIDATAVSGQNPCIEVTAARVTIRGLTLRGCKADGINAPNTTGLSQVVLENLVISSVGGDGVEMFGTQHRIGPDVTITGAGSNGLKLQGAAMTVVGVVVDSANAYGIQLTPPANNTTVRRTVVARCGSSGLLVSGDNSVLEHVTAVSNVQNGALFSTGTLGHTVTNGIFAFNTQNGLLFGASSTSTISRSDFWSNGASACSGGGCATAMGGLAVDPLFVAPASADYRLQPGSGCINAAIDLGLDLNDALPGNFNGTAPDVGALEAP